MKANMRGNRVYAKAAAAVAVVLFSSWTPPWRSLGASDANHGLHDDIEAWHQSLGSVEGHTDVEGTEPLCEAEAALTRGQALQDLKHWYQRVVTVHPAPFTSIGRSVLEESLVAAARRLGPSVDRTTLFIAMARIAARLRDSHTALLAPKNALTRLPWALDHERLCLTQAIGTVPAGACLSTLQGVSVPSLLGRARTLVSAENQLGLDEGAPQRIWFTLPKESRTQPLAIAGHTHEGRPFEAVLLAPTEQKEEPSPITLSPIKDSYLLITLRTMTAPLELYQQGIAEALRYVEYESIRGIVVDLRQNDGGSTEVAAQLLHHLSPRPYRTSARKIWRVSAPMQRQLIAQEFPATEYLEAAPGKVFNVEFPMLPTMRSFQGPVVYLIGRHTKSAGMMLANAVGDLGLGLLVGESPISPPNYFGEIHTFQLPCSKLQATVSSARFVRANGDEKDRSTVKPHLHVERTRAAAAAGRDPALGAAVQALDYWHSHRDELLRASRAGKNGPHGV